MPQSRFLDGLSDDWSAGLHDHLDRVLPRIIGQADRRFAIRQQPLAGPHQKGHADQCGGDAQPTDVEHPHESKTLTELPRIDGVEHQAGHDDVRARPDLRAATAEHRGVAQWQIQLRRAEPILLADFIDDRHEHRHARSVVQEGAQPDHRKQQSSLRGDHGLRLSDDRSSDHRHRSGLSQPGDDNEQHGNRQQRIAAEPGHSLHDGRKVADGHRRLQFRHLADFREVFLDRLVMLTKGRPLLEQRVRFLVGSGKQASQQDHRQAAGRDHVGREVSRQAINHHGNNGERKPKFPRMSKQHRQTTRIWGDEFPRTRSTAGM